MYTLGLNSVLHDSSACLVHDGVVVAATEEERFSRIRHHRRANCSEPHLLPYQSIDYCLREAGIVMSDVDHIAFSFNPFPIIPRIPPFVLPTAADKIAFQKEPPNYLAITFAAITAAPLGFRVEPMTHTQVPYHLHARFRGEHKFQFHFLNHHLCHAISAFYPSPFERAAVLTLDGIGETTSTSYTFGDGQEIQLLGQVHAPNSLGFLWATVTDYLGFRMGSHEYKVMAMASFAKPRFLDRFLELIEVGEGGHYTLHPYDLEAEFGPHRLRGGPLEDRHYEVAASVQAALEITVLKLLRWLHKETKVDQLCMAGGVALNCVMNSVLREQGPFKEIWVQPATNDAGTALGAALWMDAQMRPGSKRNYVMEDAYLGPAYADEEIEEFLKWAKIPYRKLDDVPNQVAELLCNNVIIGWFQGRMEFGPRALGARSILASPIDPRMKERLNEIKDREDFRPVAPIVLEEKAAEWFEGGQRSPFMLFTFPVKEDKKDRIPSVHHVDQSSRIQTLTRKQNPLTYDLISAFEARTGVPVLINTSFNSRGEPIVCTPQHAIECFWTTPLDALVIGSFLVEKPGP